MSQFDRDHKWVYLFSEGTSDLKWLLGGKGAGVAEMTQAGLPVPPGFTITTEACNAYYANDRQYAEGMWTQANLALRTIEEQTGKTFGNASNPLLVSVRSGAAISMPGMMDTVLNLGLNDETAEGLALLTGDRRFALDAYRRFIAMFGRIVMDVENDKFERVLTRMKSRTQGGECFRNRVEKKWLYGFDIFTKEEKTTRPQDEYSKKQRERHPDVSGV
jgi:pyruvate,orthophosphate dikinase